VSISPQMRQLFMEIVERELPYFRGAGGVIDKDGLLHSVIDGLQRQHPQQAAAYFAEAAFTAGRTLINEHLRFQQGIFIGGDLRRRAREYVQVPLDGTNKFVTKRTLDMTRGEVKRMRQYHHDKGEGHKREADWFDLLDGMMGAAGITDEGRVSEVLHEAPVPEEVAV
jgi:hypothetical protein